VSINIKCKNKFWVIWRVTKTAEMQNIITARKLPQIHIATELPQDNCNSYISSQHINLNMQHAGRSISCATVNNFYTFINASARLAQKSSLYTIRLPIIFRCSGAARGEAPPYGWTSKNYVICVCFHCHGTSSYHTIKNEPYKFPMHCSKCVSFWGTSYSRPPIDPYLTSPLLQNPGDATVQMFSTN